MNAPAKSSDSRTLSLVLIGGCLVFMLCWSWQHWCDPVVDFGREIYVPWRLSLGEVLYRDINYFNGPLSPYLHALLFKIVGPSLRALVWFNIANIVLITAMVYYLARRIAGEFAGPVAGLSFVLLFAFAQYTGIANYNYVCPYSYELTHGITLCLAGLICVDRFAETGRNRWAMAAGVALGLVFLTKAEVFLAGAVALSAAIALRANRRQLLLYLLGAMIPPIVATGLLMTAMSGRDAANGLAGSWKWVLDSKLTSLRYFRELNGTADLLASLTRLLLGVLGYGAVAGIAFVVSKLSPRAARICSFAVAVVLVVAGAYWIGEIPWNDVFRPLPLLLTILLIVMLVKHRAPLPIAGTLFAVALLPKMLLNVQIAHYGFALAMPGILVLIVCMVVLLPRWAKLRGGDAVAARIVLIGVVVATAQYQLRLMNRYFQAATTPIGSGADSFVADPRAILVDRARLWIEKNTKPNQTVVAMPEGLLLNYLTRRANPTSHLNFTPPAILMFGEGNMLRALEVNPPDFVVIVEVDTSEYGTAAFGIDYASELNGYISSKYAVAETFNGMPYTGNNFAIAIYRRKS